MLLILLFFIFCRFFFYCLRSNVFDKIRLLVELSSLVLASIRIFPLIHIASSASSLDRWLVGCWLAAWLVSSFNWSFASFVRLFARFFARSCVQIPVLLRFYREIPSYFLPSSVHLSCVSGLHDMVCIFVYKHSMTFDSLSKSVVG